MNSSPVCLIKFCFVFFPGIDAKCLRNRHTEELVNKDYFKKWLTLKSKTNAPIILIISLWEAAKIALFGYFDGMLVWYEDRLTTSLEESCTVTANITCAQNLGIFLQGKCSLVTVYSLMILLMLITFTELVRDAFNWIIIGKHAARLSHTPLGKKNPLVHALAYYAMANLATVCIILNVSLRFIRHMGWSEVPQAVDSTTYFVIYFGYITAVIYLVQLLPYFGFVAVAMKLMLKDTLIFMMFILISAAPYLQLFGRVINEKRPLDECDPGWVDQRSSMYSTFLLLFNMKNFENTEGRSTSQIVQLHVSNDNKKSRTYGTPDLSQKC